MEKILADVGISIHSILDPDPRIEQLTEKMREIFQYHYPDIFHEIAEKLLTPAKN
ncbi:MAG: hypothetical protein AAB915_01145 [Patescibacteria group bacterium]